jgi:hypothetical protein
MIVPVELNFYAQQQWSCLDKSSLQRLISGGWLSTRNVLRVTRSQMSSFEGVSSTNRHSTSTLLANTAKLAYPPQLISC